MLLPQKIIAAGWAVLALVWVVFALNTKASRAPGIAGVRRAARLVLLVAIGAAIANLITRGRLSLAPPAHPGTALAWTGAFCAIAGIALAIWSRVHLGRNWGIPMSVRVEPELVTSGPYALVRHPIYAGILLGAAGSALAANAVWFIALAVLAVHFFMSALVEERDMAAQFPRTYPAYAARTKMLIPFVL